MMIGIALEKGRRVELRVILVSATAVAVADMRRVRYNSCRKHVHTSHRSFVMTYNLRIRVFSERDGTSHQVGQ
jgi:hypothetical protein